MLGLLQTLIKELSSKHIQYCHWKSNRSLDEVFFGDTDVDLLVAIESVGQFHACLGFLGFKQAILPSTEESISIRHFYGIDEPSGKLLHLHVHYKVVTGGCFLKNYHFPVERMLLENCWSKDGLWLSSKSAELILLVIRKTIEHGSPFECMMVRREYPAIKLEIEWLLSDGEDRILRGPKGVLELLRVWFPTVSEDLFLRSFNALRRDASLLTLFMLAHHMKKSLKMYAIYPAVTSIIIRTHRVMHRVFRRFVVRRRTHRLQVGGAIVAVVGPDATGKSTVVQALENWLGEHFNVVSIHSGKPPSSWLTWIPNKGMPALRKMLPSFRTGTIESELEEKGVHSLTGLRLLVFALRSLMIAYDRKRLLARIYRASTRGSIIISDRYPSSIIGAMDSAQIDPTIQSISTSTFYSMIARLEQSLYKAIPPANVIVELSVPVEVALKRNIDRKKVDSEDDEYVRRRHRQSLHQRYESSHVLKVDTSRDFPTTILHIKAEVWGHL